MHCHQIKVYFNMLKINTSKHGHPTTNMRRSNTYEMQNSHHLNDHDSTKRIKWSNDVRSDAGRGAGMNLPAWMTQSNNDRKFVEPQHSSVLKNRPNASPITYGSQQHA